MVFEQGLEFYRDLANGPGAQAEQERSQRGLVYSCADKCTQDRRCAGDQTEQGQAPEAGGFLGQGGNDR